MVKAWSHLPNAHHIDWVLDSLKENPKLWDAARDADRIAAWNAARIAAWDAARIAAWDAASGAAWDAASGAARDAASNAAWVAIRDAFAALIAYDDCDQFLAMTYEKLKVWAVLSEDPCAILLLPMVYVKERLNEQCMVTPA